MADSQTVTRQRTQASLRQDEEQGLGGSRDHLNEKSSPARVFTNRPMDGFARFQNRFLRRGKKKVGTLASLRNLALSSWLNLFIVFIPLAWIAHYQNANNHEEPERHFPYPLTFSLSFLAIIPLEHLFDYGGEQMAFYCGKGLGDLIVITLNNAVEAALAIILLTKCELKLLQATIIGVVILHLLLIPGTSFIVGGARLMHQDLHPHLSQLNHTLLTIASFFAAVDRGVLTVAGEETPSTAVIDGVRGTFLQMSRGLAIILLTVYIISRIYLHNPPGDDNALTVHPNAPEALKEQEREFEERDPEVSQWVCIAMLVITIAIMTVTAEWLVDSIEFVREEGGIQQEWFGLILLPIVSFSADGALAIGFFLRYLARHFFGTPTPPETLAKARAIDLSIQFTLFWMPFIVLLGWWTDKPMVLLFDLFEVALLIGACFIVNYVTADSKTNYVEGYAMVAFYVMIALCAWFYHGQQELDELLVGGSSTCAGAAHAE